MRRGSKEFAKSAEGSNIVKRAEAVNASAAKLADEMAELQESLKAISPQLEIYKPEIANNLAGFKADRQQALEDTQEIIEQARWRPGATFLRSEWPRYLLTCRDDLWEVYVKACDNQSKIEDICEDFRLFLVREISFKESF